MVISAVPSSHASSPHGPEEDLSVEEVAERLGLPASMLVRRVEAGDVPARRVLGPQGVTYRLRLEDLGVSLDPEEPESMNGNGAATPDDVSNGASEGAPAPAPPKPFVFAPPPAPGPQEQLAAMTLDPRELVAGLLDRWEKTLEQRILAEQRQRFESELDARQSQIKQLQLEIEQERAQHAATLAEREKAWAERERDLAERERAAAEKAAAAGRRGWFGRH